VRVGRLPGLGFVQPAGPDCVAHDGFTLHAGVCVPGGPRSRERLEQLCRYVACPALASERLSELDDGRVAYDLRRPWSDGTHRLVFEPVDFLARLSALVPPPRAHLLTNHGVLAPAASMRAAIVPAGPWRRRACEGTGSSRERACGRHPWAELMKRVFLVDVLRCPRCGGRRRVLAAITESRVVRAILASLGLPAEPAAGQAVLGVSAGRRR
jgi:hypothetical protein